ncbi:MAG: hypothetical protein ABIH23_31860 [bacterium]
MGHTCDAKCLKCGEEFSVNEGGGFSFHLLHCDRCGKEKDVTFEELGEIHLQYIKGLPGPYCMATSERDRAIQEEYEGEAITEEEYHAEVENIAGVHEECGGQFRFEAPPRCPKCGSDEIEKSEPTVLYD